MQSGIYVITCAPEDGRKKFYVGQSCDVPRRISEHLGSLRRGSHYNLGLQASFCQHGASAFSAEFVEPLPIGQLQAGEQFWLDFMAGHAQCFNVAVSADNPAIGLKRSQETRDKIRAAKTGLRHTEQTKLLISQVQIGRKRGPCSPDRALKISVAQVGEKNHQFGKTGSSSKRSKAVLGVHIDSGVTVEFESANLARSAGFHPTGITACCRGEMKSYKRYRWSFKSQ